VFRTDHTFLNTVFSNVAIDGGSWCPSHPSAQEQTMTRPHPLIASFLVLFVVFLVTHLASFPGSLAHLMEITENQPILDLQASFSSAETYARLEGFGEHGRQMYMRTMLTIDTIFPLSAFAFLFLFARHATRRLETPHWITVMLPLLSIAYLTLDFLENTTVLVLLTTYPDRWDFLAANIGFLTVGKRASMYAALLAPLVLMLVAEMRRRLSATTTSPMTHVVTRRAPLAPHD
jgi:hypothetical protein